MSILIKGIDMPKSCGECKFFSGLGYGFHCYLNGKHITFIGEVEDFCPLVEIPTPHGRLIDGDALISDLRIYLSKYCGEQGYITQDDIINAPTILEAEDEDE